MKIKELETFSTEETFALGEEMGRAAKPGEVYSLIGDLGVGKTVFTQGMARGLGITEPVSSPTFTIVQVYEQGRMPFYHFDVYRIGDLEEMEEIGYEDIRVESVYSDEKNNASLADNFANASLIYYKNVGLSDEEYAGLKKEFLHICDTEPVEKRAHRLYIHGFRP